MVKGKHLFSRMAQVALIGALLATAPALLAPEQARAGSLRQGDAKRPVDKLHLKDGRVLEGSIEKEVSGYVWFKSKVGGIEQSSMFKPEEISKLERASDAAPGGETTASKVETSADPKTAAKPATTANQVSRAVVITAGDRTDGKDMVGQYMCAKPLMDAIPKLEEEIGKDGSGVLVLRIDSGGGLLLEIERIHEVIEKEFKPRFRTVAWIKWAISAAAMSSHVIEEIYFYPEGNYGACTGFNGATMEAIKDRPLEEVLFQFEKASARGKKDPKIMRSMQILEPLSCTIDSNGDVHWYQDATSGEILVNSGEHILTFTSETARKCKFSKGTTADYSELARLMGYEELNWVGARDKNTPWPVSQSELIQRRFRDKTFEDEKSTNAFFTEFQQSMEIARAQPDKVTRGKFVGRARSALAKIKSMIKNNPNFALLVLNQPPGRFDEWAEEQERILRDLAK